MPYAIIKFNYAKRYAEQNACSALYVNIHTGPCFANKCKLLNILITHHNSGISVDKFGNFLGAQRKPQRRPRTITAGSLWPGQPLFVFPVFSKISVYPVGLRFAEKNQHDRRNVFFTSAFL